MKKTIVRILIAVLCGLVLVGLLFLGKTVYRICKMNYKPASVADFFLLGTADADSCLEMIEQDYDTYELTPTVTIRTSKVRYQGKEVLMDYVGEKTTLGVRYHCPVGGTTGSLFVWVDNLDYGNSKLNPHNLPMSAAFIYAFDDCTVFQVIAEFDYFDSNGEAAYCHENDTSAFSNGDTCRYFVAPKMDELPESYCIFCEEDTITRKMLVDVCD